MSERDDRGHRLLIRGAQVASEAGLSDGPADVLVEGGVIAAVGAGLDVPDGARTIEASGRVLLPGLFDVHVHFRDPGREDQETIRSGAAAAANGGVTGVVMMPNTEPAIDSGGAVQAVMDNARDNARIEVHTAGCITKGRAGGELASIASMQAHGVRMLTDDGSPVGDPLVLRRAMEYARNYDLIIASHCETMGLSGDGAMNEGRTSYALGLPGIPSISEEICIERDIRIAGYTGARLHIQHVSTARGIEAIRRGKEDGVAVTCEVTPHHLLFCEEDIVDYDTNFKMNPPLRTREDQAALLEALVGGVFDVIATDHAPHTWFEKNRDFTGAPFGITGLESALPSLYDGFVRTGKFGWDVIVQRFSAGPRRLMGLEPVAVADGQPADFVLFNPERATGFTPEFMLSKSNNTPFLNREVQGMVELVVHGSDVLVDRVSGGNGGPAG